MEEELDKSLRAFGIDPASGRLSSSQYWAAHEELQRRRSRALANRPASHKRRAGFLHTTIMWHIQRVCRWLACLGLSKEQMCSDAAQLTQLWRPCLP